MSERDGGGDERRFFFVHLLKTAGTSLFERLKCQFDEAEIYPDPSDGDLVTVAPQLSVDQLLVRWPERHDQVRIVTGHFPLCASELIGGGFTTLTVLREPVERTLSFLRHNRMWTPADRDGPLEAIYDDPFRFQGLIHNHMVKMLGLRTEEMTAGALTPVTFTRAHLERAQANLVAVDVVGLQDDFEGFCGELERRYGWDLGAPMVANPTEPTEVSDAFRQRIAEDNALDVELYEFATRLVAARRDGVALRGT